MLQFENSLTSILEALSDEPSIGKAGYGRITKATEDIRKTRGVPSDGSNNRGPRGQELSFRSFDGTNQGSRNVGQMVFGYLAVGLTAFIVGYSIMKGKKKAK